MLSVWNDRVLWSMFDRRDYKSSSEFPSFQKKKGEWKFSFLASVYIEISLSTIFIYTPYCCIVYNTWTCIIGKMVWLCVYVMYQNIDDLEGGIVTWSCYEETIGRETETNIVSIALCMLRVMGPVFCIR